MELIFRVLCPIHPALPTLHLILLAIGMVMPAIYRLKRKMLLSIPKIFENAKNRDRLAIAALAAWRLIVAITALIFAVVFAPRAVG